MSQIPPSPEFMRGLHEAEATYRLLVEGIPAILYIDANDDLSTNLYTSPQIEQILGFTTEEWRRDPGFWLARLHDDDRERALQENRRANETGGPYRSEYRLIARDGRAVWFRDEAVLVRNEAGEPLFWRGIMLDITEQKRAEEKLKRSLDILRRTMEERRVLLTRLEEAQEEERRRIAADIHDDSIQVMGAADMRLQLLLRDIEDPERRQAGEEIHETLTLAIERLRHLLFELRPPMLDREGLAAALLQYVRQSGLEAGFESELDDRLEEEPPPDTRATLFRIAQEAITNARKHASASRVEVLVESADGGVLLRISDDGAGFDPAIAEAPEPGHLGLSAMSERAELAGGWCRIDSKSGHGTTVECWLPRHASASDPPDERTA
ncbi:MAG: PAS domain-containing protein [Actinobacteria bacterium]|nr:PAS domain-containing protein [Actinomycetota bacterium]